MPCLAPNVVLDVGTWMGMQADSSATQLARARKPTSKIACTDQLACNAKIASPKATRGRQIIRWCWLQDWTKQEHEDAEGVVTFSYRTEPESPPDVQTIQKQMAIVAWQPGPNRVVAVPTQVGS